MTGPLAESQRGAPGTADAPGLCSVTSKSRYQLGRARPGMLHRNEHTRSVALRRCPDQPAMSYFQILNSRQNDAAARPAVSAAWAIAALALVLLWQFLTVRYNRAGNWTALFLIGQDYRMPPELAAGAYRFPGQGFDGEMYRVVAHDPFLERGYA